MNVVIIGNGLAGTIAAKTLRETDARAEIHIYAQESVLYYPRPNLIEYIAGRLPYGRLFAFPEAWYADRKIEVRLGTPVERIFASSREIEIGGGRRVSFDALLLANGASSFVPPMSGSERNGVFSLRTLDDAQAILAYAESHPRVAVIGGGLLGLEIARALRVRGAEVDIVEFFPYLLPRQLDPRGGELLKAEIEKSGIRVHLGLATEEILGSPDVRGLRFKGGREIQVDMAIVAAGVRPNLKLAQEAAIQTDRGVVVNDFLETNVPGIYAAGDGVQHKGRTYGIIPASFDQARTVAANILGQKKSYAGTVPSNTLKVAGIQLTSVGLVNPDGGEYEEHRYHNAEEGIYKKIVLLNGQAVGAIWMGTRNGVDGITRAVMKKANVARWKDDLFQETFDFSVL
jgi:nitrite reductase (NADH) large subunit